MGDNIGTCNDPGILVPDNVVFDLVDDEDDDDDVPPEVEIVRWWRPPVVDEPEPEMVDSE